MARINKKAEHAVTDAGKFPIESCRERIARKYGEDAVALSGPAAGSNLADSVCRELSSRWDKISDRFAGSEKKTVHLAMKLASSLSKKDDTEEAVKDIEAMGHKKEAATYAEYLKAYAMDELMDKDLDGMMNEVNEENDLFKDDSDGDDMNAPEGDEEVPSDDLGGGDDMVEFDLNDDSMSGDLGSGMGEETVTIELPKEVANEIMDSIKVQTEGADDLGGEAMPGTEIPGEPAEAQKPGEQIVTGEPPVAEEPKMDTPMDSDKEDASACGPCKSSAPQTQMAASQKEVKVAQADGSGGSVPQTLGNAKEKAVEAPKALEDGNVKPEGHTAGGNKFSDGKTMKNEQKFDAKPIDKGSVSGGSSSLMGPDESYPEGGPKVPAGSAPIHGEVFEGGELMTKGTVIASAPQVTITSGGILVEVDSKRLLAKASISGTPSEAMVKAIEAVKYEGDAKKFAAAVLKAAKAASVPSVEIGSTGVAIKNHFASLVVKASIKDADKKLASSIAEIKYEGDAKKFAEGVAALLKQAKCLPEGDTGCTHTDTGKLEGDKFTNDAEKKAEDAPASAKVPSGKDDETKIDTAKKSPENDGKKEPEADKKAASEKQQKTAGDKKVEDPKPISEGNLEQEGYSANGKTFQDGKPMKNEQKFEAHEIKKEEVSKGDASLMGSEQPAAKEGPSVPSPENKGKLGNEELEGGDRSTKGTVIADNKKSEESIIHESQLREARIKAASVYVADLLAHGEISPNEYSETLDRYAAFTVPQIKALAEATKKARTRVAEAAKAREVAEQGQQKQAGLVMPIVISSSKNEKPLSERLMEHMKLTKSLDSLQKLEERK